MSKVEFARDKLRTRFSKLMDEYEAMILFLARMDETVNPGIRAPRNVSLRSG